MKNRIYIFLLMIAIVSSCKKEIETIPNNTPPYYGEIPTVLIENYVNRIFIDLIGREPLDTEMEEEAKYLKDNDLKMEYRDSLITKLMTNTVLDTAIGDSTTIYKTAYYHRIYDMTKARMIEGASNEDLSFEINILEQAILSDSLMGGNQQGIDKRRFEVNKLKKIISSEVLYMNGVIEINEVYARMLYNAIYDLINMNTFNFVNASFDDLFFRFPTTDEFDNGFNMIEFNEARLLFNLPGQNKGDYIEILTNSREYYEGMINWVYLTMLSREPTTLEKAEIMETFFYDHDLQKVQKKILMTDEYAHFD
ncbi:MAG: hypothetical protein H8E84_04190 [Flavobacteriales bacterium]|nr:hypothetical protein [Flavobacteriales bacterium]